MVHPLAFSLLSLHVSHQFQHGSSFIRADVLRNEPIGSPLLLSGRDDSSLYNRVHHRFRCEYPLPARDCSLPAIRSIILLRNEQPNLGTILVLCDLDRLLPNG